MSQQSSSDPQAVMHAFEAAAETFFATAQGVPGARQHQPGACGDWSAQNILAHLEGWAAEAQRRYARYPYGVGKINYNIDAFNAVSVRRRVSMDYDEVLALLQTRCASLLETARARSEAQHIQDGRYLEWLRILMHEFETHGAQLAALAGRAEAR